VEDNSAVDFLARIPLGYIFRRFGSILAFDKDIEFDKVDGSKNELRAVILGNHDIYTFNAVDNFHTIFHGHEFVEFLRNKKPAPSTITIRVYRVFLLRRYNTNGRHAEDQNHRMLRLTAAEGMTGAASAPDV